MNTKKETLVGIVIVTGSCCIPGFAAVDDKARQAVQQALSETGVNAEVEEMSASAAMMGGLPSQTMAFLKNAPRTGQAPLPMILINGKAISYGVPIKLETVKTALRQAEAKEIVQEKRTDEQAA